MPSKLSVINHLYGTAIAVFCLILQLLVFILVVVGTPLDSFEYTATGAPTVCLSMWGPREKCNRVKLRKNVPYKGMGCASSEKIMTAASAFAIISIPFALIAMIVCVLLSVKIVVGPLVLSVFAVLTFVFTLICWACQIGAFHSQCKTTYGVVTIKTASLSAQGYKLTESPALFIAAWCLECVACFLTFLLE